ncbi:MAG: class I SAM-dependent methyltransferase [Nitrospirae bacterium]|nr:MAG: class I SAM-dependent methyltransferase [Nitrospirota bacterium]
MRREVLSFLVCPRKKAARPCRGSLRVERVLKSWDQDVEDFLEAIVRCERCRAQYPVLCGIPILHPETPRFLRQNYYLLVEHAHALTCLSDAMRVELTNMALLDLKSASEEVFPPQRRFNRDEQQDFHARIGPYLCNHYDDLASIVSPCDPLYHFLLSYPKRNPHTVLEQFAVLHGNGSGGLAVDIGCNVGGLIAKQAQRYDFVYGVDLSFEALLLASRILKQRPTALRRYRLYRDGWRYELRPIRGSRCPNVEFVVACATSLPFRAETFETVSSCNVIDIVAKPLNVLDEQLRVLKPAGLFLTSDPYEFYGPGTNRLKTQGRRSPLSIIKDRITETARIVREDDYVPWVTHTYERLHMVYYNHCLAAIKQQKAQRNRTEK